MAAACICGECGLAIKGNSKAIECSLCFSWYHKGHSGLANTVFDKICASAKKNSKHNWTCASCCKSEVSGDILLPKRFSEAETQVFELQHNKDANLRDVISMMSAFFKLISEQNNSLQKILGEIQALKDDKDKRIMKLEKTVADLSARVNKDDESNINLNPEVSAGRIMDEIHERATRAKNIILYNLNESNSNDTNVRILHDKTKTQEIITKLETVDDEFKVFRIGKKQDDSKPRPLKVILSCEKAAVNCLKNGSKLKETGIRMSADLTRSQREQRKKVLTEFHRRIDQGEHNIGIRYANGLPHIKIIKEELKRVSTRNQSKND